ncbi:MAG: DNA repair protein RadA [Phycisphaerae bacterium]|jgi:DNA repair protein RadA/Sms|nr:DNA repair protein RadA [Phycisphaerae bacterium]
MAKVRVTFLCRSCGSSHPRWMGKCPDCGTWDSLEKFVPPSEPTVHALGAAAQWVAGHDEEDGPGRDPNRGGAPDIKSIALPLADVTTSDAPRIPTGIGELDRVLGSGVVPGSAVLLGGDPGIGKSTLLLQAAACMADAGRRVLYVSSEESAQQVKLRAERVLAEGDQGPQGASSTQKRRRSEHLFVLSETNLGRIAEQARRVQPEFLVIDSVQMLWSTSVEAAPGSVTQLRRACLELVWLAKASNIAVAMVGHVTKEGELAGPKLLEHLVDVVLQFEGDRHHEHRVVRAIKNRFGSTQEIGLFEMTGSGLAEVRDGSLMLADPTEAHRPGTVYVPSLAGSRCLVAEVQALTATSVLGSAKRRASGIDGNRLAMLIAVLEKHGGLRLADQDVFAQAAGGVRIIEPAADLAIALAITGAHYTSAVPIACAAVGEIGLTGEIRAVRQLEQRLTEVVRRGGRTLGVPASQLEAAQRCLAGISDHPTAGLHEAIRGVNLVGLRSIRQAIELLTPVASGTRQVGRPNAVSG